MTACDPAMNTLTEMTSRQALVSSSCCCCCCWSLLAPVMVTMNRWCTIAEKGRGLREDGGWMINDRRSIRTQYIVRSILVLQYGIVVDGIRMMMGTDNGSMMMRSAAG